MTHGLTELQLRILDVLWDRETATVREVQEALEPEHALARTTVATMLSRLEDRGVIGHREDGREYRYHALVEKAGVRRSMLAEFTHRVFEGDVPALVGQLLGWEKVGREDIERVRALLEERERDRAELDDSARTPAAEDRLEEPAE